MDSSNQLMSDSLQSQKDVAPLDVKGIEGEREHLVSTAVKFLLNPRVRKTSIHQKLQFLRQKGLTEHEINTVCQRAGVASDSETKVQVPDHSSLQQLASYNDYPVISFWAKVKDVANLVALFSIGSFSLYCLWKQFVAPTIFGRRSHDAENYEKLLFSITKLNENVTELKDLIRTIQETQTLQKQLTTTSLKSRTSHELKEIRNELSSIKGLLLGRTQFPTSPSVSSGIPSWQMLEVEGDDENGGGSSSKDLVKSKRKERKSGRKQEKLIAGGSESEVKVGGEGEVEDSTAEHFVDMTGSTSSTMSIIRKTPPGETDSNNGFTSGSSCEVVFMGSEKHDSNSGNSCTSSE